jgi:hypothetical protein
MLTLNEQVTHATDICLRLSTNGADTIGFPTITDLRIMPVYMSIARQSIGADSPVSIDIVVEGDLFALDHVMFCKDTHP